MFQIEWNRKTDSKTLVATLLTYKFKNDDNNHNEAFEIVGPLRLEYPKNLQFGHLNRPLLRNKLEPLKLLIKDKFRFLCCLL